MMQVASSNEWATIQGQKATIQGQNSEASTALAMAVDHLAFGVALLDERGNLRAANQEAARLLGDERLSDDEPRVGCCELFGCGTPAGPPHGRCLTELALEAGGRLPEIRIDLGADRDTAVWVSTARAPGGISLSLRPGMRGDRRRRTEPHWVAGPMLRIHTFGSIQVASGESSLKGNWLDHRTGRLLKFLITHRREVLHAEQIVAALWPNAGPEAVGTLRQCVHALRARLEPGRARNNASSFVLARNGGYQLDMARVWVDVDEFEQKVRCGLAAAQAGEAPAALADLTAGLELYTGDFLGDELYAEWVFTERDRLRDLAAEALRTTSRIHQDSGETEAAAVHLQRLAAVDPYDLDVQRQLIGLHLGAGRRSQAVRRYERLRRQMLTEFGEALNFELRDLSPVAQTGAVPGPGATHSSQRAGRG
jgi:DNA-binding SARP family transcriptional activator